ncbi:MAG TPA: hypothetical protein VGK25_11920 [Ignavibacteria bacterium]|jgi:hypothetical protein
MNKINPSRWYPPFREKNIIILLFILLQAAYLLAEYNITGHQFGVPLDDVWIHFRYAENFAAGNFFQYNPGEPTPGTTSPIWVAILSIPFLFSPNLIIPFALFLSSIFFLYALLELFDLCVKLGLSSENSMLITILTLLAGRLAWSSLSGMEITLFVLFCILVIKNHIKEIDKNKLFISTGILLGIACVTRPEAYLLALIYYTISVLLFRKTLKENIRNLVFSLIIFIIIILPYPLFCYFTIGEFLPNTYHGQVTQMNYLPNFEFLVETGKLFVKDNCLILILWFGAMGYFIFSLIRRKINNKFLLINLWVILLPAISSIIAPNWRHHGRYLIPLIPFINIVSVNLFEKICNYFVTGSFKHASLYRKLLAAAILIFTISSTAIFAGALGWNVDNINNQQVKIGNWLRENLPNEKAFGMNDIGAITFITKKYVVDMEGLVTPQVFKFQKMSYEDGAKSLLMLLKEKGVNYMIIYPDWYDYMMKKYSSSFQQVFSARLEKNTICGGIEMFVYKINWGTINLSP